jgi:uncharacterized protein (TIGR02145 family)
VINQNKYFLISATVILLFTACSGKDSSSDTFSDSRDGKTYKTVKIGNQVWMAENLQATQYRDGTPIPMLMDNKDWTGDTSGAYCYYNHSYKNSKTYGLLYNRGAILNPKKLAPAGWHIPSDTEWQTLVDFLGGEKEAGGKLKSDDHSLWNENVGANNQSGFSALPAGSRASHKLITGLTSNYEGLGLRTFFASVSEKGNKIIWVRDLQNLNPWVNRTQGDGVSGISVRCIKD